MSALSGMVEHPWDASTGGAKVAGLPQAADWPGLHEQVRCPWKEREAKLSLLNYSYVLYYYYYF